MLAWGLVAFAAKPNDAPPVEPLPVEFVSATEFSQLTAGVKNAPKPAENPKPLVDKVGEDKPVKQLAPKVADKPEITTDTTAPPPPKSEAKPEAKPDPKPAEKAETPKPAEVKPDRVAEELKKEEAKKPPKPEKKEPQFKPDQIAEQLKRDEAKKPVAQIRRQSGGGVARQARAAAPGRDRGDAQRRGGARRPDRACRAIIAERTRGAARETDLAVEFAAGGQRQPGSYVVTIHIRLTRDHRLIGQPQVLTGGDGPLFEATRDSAVRAVLQAQPYDMLSQSTYDLWKELEINFNPREVFGG